MRISVLITFLCLTTSAMLLAATARGQNLSSTEVTLGLQHESLEKAIKKLETQTSLHFYYRRSDIKDIKNLTLPAGSYTLTDLLNLLLDGTFISFRQIDGTILLERTQQAYTISGKVVDEKRQPVAFATVSLSKGSKTVQAMQTDTAGNFKLTTPEKGDYLLHISAVGRDSLSVALTLADQKTVTLPDIVLATLVNQLKQVNVVATRPYIEEKIDRTVLNVGSLKANAGVSTLEVLERAPGVMVDPGGNITFRGKSGVIVLVDDRPTYLSGDQLANYLRGLPASQLSQIELMSNPPAKYDASGTAGLINIRTKKNNIHGFSGSVSGNLGKNSNWQDNESVNLNYRTGKINLFATGGYGIQNNLGNLHLQRNYFDAGGNLSSVYQENSIGRNIGYNPNLKLGMDYFASPKTTLGVVLTGFSQYGHGTNPTTSLLYDNKGILDSTIIANNRRQGKFNNEGVNLNYTHELGQPGQVLSADLDYLGYQQSGNASFLNNTYLPDGSLTDTQLITDNLPSTIHIYSAKSDFVQPLKGKAKIEAGIKSSYVHTDNQANYFDVVNGVSMVDDNLSNRFLYQENINSGYINFSKEWQRVALQAGLRAENTNVQGHQLGNAKQADSSFTQHYTDLFPTTYLSYKLDTAGHHLLKVSYGRRIDRPAYQDLNPFITIRDKYTYNEGNPLLRPQFSDNYELSYSYKGILTAKLYYNNTQDYQADAILQQNQVFISTTTNLGQYISKGFNIDLETDLLKWWNVSLYTEVVNNVYKGQLFSSTVNFNSTQFYIVGYNSFDLSNGWSAQCSGFYITKRKVGQYDLNARTQANAAIQKKILQNKGSLRLGIRDIFYSNFSSGSILGIPGATSTYKNKFDSRTVNLSFSYNFGNSANSPKKRDTGGAQSEQGRVKQ